MVCSKLSASHTCFFQTMHHVEIDFPLACHWYLSEWQCWHVGWRAEFRSDCQFACSCTLPKCEYVPPPSLMCLERMLPFRRAGIGDLGALGMTHAGMNMANGGENAFYCFRLILA
jgi:hypothetical protein